MKYLAAIALTFTIISSSAVAFDENSYTVSQQLGTILGSDQACDLEYDQNAIQKYVLKHVDANDMDFASMLNSQTVVTRLDIKQMSASSLVAHCTQIRRVAKQYGFTK